MLASPYFPPAATKRLTVGVAWVQNSAEAASTTMILAMMNSAAASGN